MTNFSQFQPRVDPFKPVRVWLSNINVRNPKVATWICQQIPGECPFARDIKIWGERTFSIPPLCKLNPLYEDLVMLRFRALCYLTDECNQGVQG